VGNVGASMSILKSSLSKGQSDTGFWLQLIIKVWLHELNTAFVTDVTVIKI